MSAPFVDHEVVVEVPATSANLGPGFDSLGLALGVGDTLRAQAYDGPLRIEVSGSGEGEVPLDERHLVWRAMAQTFALAGVEAPGVHLTCTNVIPHARGMGSSSAAIVGGIALARALMADDPLDDDAALDLANRIEGHPDNVAPAQLGGFTIAGVRAGRVVVARLDVDERIGGVVLVPPTPVETEIARGLLPATVPHADAAANAGASALLVAALTGRPDLLLAGTEDLLHQGYRRPAMPATLELIEALRADGIAAVVSGAGPSVLALCSHDDVEELVRRTPSGWAHHAPTIGAPGVRVVA
ncbi:homoserine kinase [Alteromonas gracilis]